MESLNKEKDLWSNVSVEVMESRDEFGCLFDLIVFGIAFVLSAFAFTKV